jgi:hypothetical protein
VASIILILFLDNFSRHWEKLFVADFTFSQGSFELIECGLNPVSSSEKGRNKKQKISVIVQTQVHLMKKDKLTSKSDRHILVASDSG